MKIKVIRYISTIYLPIFSSSEGYSSVRMLPPEVSDLRRPAFCAFFRSRLSYQGLTLGVFLRLGEKDPTSAAAEPATVLCGAGSPFIPDIHHSQTSALDPIPALCHIRTPPGRGRGIGEERGATRRRRGGWHEGCHPSGVRGCW